MDLNKLTTKSQDALRLAQERAIANNQQQVDIVHLAAALLLQEDSIVPTVLRKMDVNVSSVLSKIEKDIAKLPRAATSMPTHVYVTPILAQILTVAEQEMAQMKDSFISTEHLLLAVLSVDTPVKKLLEENGVHHDAVLTVLSQVRGAQSVDSPEPEGKFQTLEKYTINLTRRANEDRLDPVIGRDEEIRRVMQVLSRRTKNNPVLIGE